MHQPILSPIAVKTFETVAFMWMTVFAILLSLIVTLIFVYIKDKTQTHSTLRRNYPVIVRFRYLFEGLGVFFRQYFFTDDREEMPFNRAERSWVYRAAKNIDSTIPFGSSLNIREPGTILFTNSVFPVLEKDKLPVSSIVFGKYSRNPYTTSSLFNISAMSYGAISIPAIKALSAGAKGAGIWLNTGEGGISQYHLDGGGDIVFQFGTAKFGVRTKEGGFDEEKLKEVAAYPQVKMFEIKLSQGAKPGKGGILPGIKVTEEIAMIRGIEIGKDAISPNRHPELNNIDDLLDMIHYVRETTGKPVGFKTAVGSYEFFGELCEAVNKRGVESAPDFITIDSGDGGTGAAPASLVDAMGLPIKECLPIIVDIFKNHSLKERIRIGASGKLLTPSDVAWAICVGADYVNSARGFMFALGCIQSLKCNQNTCPTGITTHNVKLQYGLDPMEKSVRVTNYAKNMEKELEIIAHACGVAEPRLLTRKHARVVLQSGHSMAMDKLYSQYENAS
jgi:glutamate synthase domain-containing protein 2